MHTFAHKQNQPQQESSRSLTPSNRLAPAASREAHPLLHLQSTTGNQAVLRLLKARADRVEAASDTEHALTREVRSDTPTTTRFAHDFSRIPVHAPAPIQPKLVINIPADVYEQEADHIAEQVMRMPEPKGEGGCPCGGGCSNCQMQRRGNGHEHLETKRVQADHTGQIAAPPIVHEVLASRGQPLDSATRSFMEPRFGHDFSQVRVHSDHLAARSAEAVAAQAYTVGADVVFAMGRYAPASRDGQRLLAHELAHVVQQNTSYSAPGIIQRSPDNQPVDSGTGVPETLLLHSTAYWPKDLDSDRKILILAANPDHAHSSWKGLPLQEQTLVAVYMARFYGMTFAKQFVDIHKAAKPPEPDFQQVGSDTTPAQLTARGFHLAGTGQMPVEIWFHPSGSRLHRLQPAEPVKKTPTPERAPVTGGQTRKKEERPKSQEPPDKVTEVDEVTRLNKKWQEISPRLWRALEIYETDIADLEANPPGEDRARLEAHYAIFNALTDLQHELWELHKQAQVVDLGLADEISKEYWAVFDRLNED